MEPAARTGTSHAFRLRAIAIAAQGTTPARLRSTTPNAVCQGRRSACPTGEIPPAAARGRPARQTRTTSNAATADRVHALRRHHGGMSPAATATNNARTTYIQPHAAGLPRLRAQATTAWQNAALQARCAHRRFGTPNAVQPAGLDAYQPMAMQLVAEPAKTAQRTHTAQNAARRERPDASQTTEATASAAQSVKHA